MIFSSSVFHHYVLNIKYLWGHKLVAEYIPYD